MTPKSTIEATDKGADTVLRRDSQKESRGLGIGTKLGPNELVDFGVLLMANTIQVDTMYQVLMGKGLFTDLSEGWTNRDLVPGTLTGRISVPP